MPTYLWVLASVSPFVVGFVVARWWAVALAVGGWALYSGALQLLANGGDAPTDGRTPLWFASLAVFLTFVAFPASTAAVGLGLRHGLRVVWRMYKSPG